MQDYPNMFAPDRDINSEINTKIRKAFNALLKKYIEKYTKNYTDKSDTNFETVKRKGNISKTDIGNARNYQSDHEKVDKTVMDDITSIIYDSEGKLKSHVTTIIDNVKDSDKKQATNILPYLLYYFLHGVIDTHSTNTTINKNQKPGQSKPDLDKTQEIVDTFNSSTKRVNNELQLTRAKSADNLNKRLNKRAKNKSGSNVNVQGRPLSAPALSVANTIIADQSIKQLPDEINGQEDAVNKKIVTDEAEKVRPKLGNQYQALIKQTDEPNTAAAIPDANAASTAAEPNTAVENADEGASIDATNTASTTVSTPAIPYAANTAAEPNTAVENADEGASIDATNTASTTVSTPTIPYAANTAAEPNTAVENADEGASIDATNTASTTVSTPEKGIHSNNADIIVKLNAAKEQIQQTKTDTDDSKKKKDEVIQLIENMLVVAGDLDDDNSAYMFETFYEYIDALYLPDKEDKNDADNTIQSILRLYEDGNSTVEITDNSKKTQNPANYFLTELVGYIQDKNKPEEDRHRNLNSYFKPAKIHTAATKPMFGSGTKRNKTYKRKSTKGRKPKSTKRRKSKYTKRPKYKRNATTRKKTKGKVHRKKGKK
jgi:hypothetical protein